MGIFEVMIRGYIDFPDIDSPAKILRLFFWKRMSTGWWIDYTLVIKNRHWSMTLYFFSVCQSLDDVKELENDV